MRTLLLLRGAPAAGKSTFIEENHLGPYTLSADDFRALICDPVLNEDGDLSISQKNDSLAWKLLFQALEARMRRGDFTIVDATHVSKTMTKKYKGLVDKYGYTAFYLDFPATLDELLSRNAERDECKRVPEAAIRRMHAMFETFEPQGYLKRIEDVSEIENFCTANADDYDHVRVIGDVHGCWTALKEALRIESPGDLCPDTLYVFAGDLLERGVENEEVFRFVLAACDLPNVVFVTGNHDAYWGKWLYGTFDLDKKGVARVPRTFGRLLAKLTEGMDDNEREAFAKTVKRAYRRFRQCYPFSFHGSKYFVCHGGLTSLPKMAYVSTHDMIHGIGSYEFDVDSAWERNYPDRTQGFTQVRGHRLASSLPPDHMGTEHSVCLEGGVERGGFLKVLALDYGDGHVVETRQKTENRVFGEAMARGPQPQDDAAGGESQRDLKSIVTDSPMTNAIIASPDIRVKRLHDHGLLSLNFTERAFRKRRWNAATVKARGLFVDAKTGDVRMRGYDKFFNLGELPETRPGRLEETLSFPLEVYRKENGFLGIASVVDGDVVLASKTTTRSPHVDMFREIFDTLADSEKADIRDVCESRNCSLLFEVCHVRDRHIIDFAGNRLWLLDAVPNHYGIGGIHVNPDFSDTVCSEIRIESPQLERKHLLFTAPSLDEVTAYADAHRHDRSIEGVVAQDGAGYMVKLKFHWYTVAKKLRGRLQVAQRTYNSGVPFGLMDDELTTRFIGFFLNRPWSEWRDMHIIDAIALYEKETGRLVMERG